MAFTKVHYTISNLHPKLVVKNYFSNTAAQKSQGLSKYFQGPTLFPSTFKGPEFQKQNSSTFKDSSSTVWTLYDREQCNYLIWFVHLVRDLAQTVTNASKQPQYTSTRQRRRACSPRQVTYDLEKVYKAWICLQVRMLGNGIQKPVDDTEKNTISHVNQ